MFCSINNQMNRKYEGDQEILKHLKFILNTSKKHKNFHTKIFIQINKFRTIPQFFNLPK